jgi:Holliday junction resolvase RusA-like endonuclease
LPEKWVLILPLKAPLMNTNGQRRAHWTQVARAKTDSEVIVLAAARKAKLKALDGPISIRIVWYSPDARKRDVDSLAVLAKSCLDALKKGNIINDDHAGIVHEVSLGPIVIARDNPRIEVWIRRVEAGWDLQDG